MCSINHDLKAIYIQIPKTGGSYVHNLLRDYYGFKTYRFTREDHKEYIGVDSYKDDERGCSKIYGFVNTRKTGILHYFKTSKELYEQSGLKKEDWNNYTKFTFIRNPYDKIVSAWKFTEKMKPKRRTFINFLNSIETCDNSIFSHSFIPQYNHLLDENNELNINYFGCFENLNEELIFILKKIGVKKITHLNYIKENIKLNQSSRENYSLYFTSDILNIVNKLFEQDLIKFKFKMCQTVEELNEDSKNYYLSETEFEIKNKQLISCLEKEDIIEIVSTPYLEQKIIKMKNYNNNLQHQKIFLELTKEHTANDKDFHINIFKNLIKNISEKMSSK